MGNFLSEIAKSFQQDSHGSDENNHSDSDEKEPMPETNRILPDRALYLSQSELVELVRSGTGHVIIDLRDEKMDYSGGHIAGSVNISDKIFYDSIPDILQKYGKNTTFILYCMYSQRRSIKCIEFYVKAIQEVIENYDKETKKSHYFRYALSKQSEEQHVDGQLGWMDVSAVEKKVEIDFCDDPMIENLTKQKLYVVEGGFFKSVNELKDTEVIEGFDETHYEQLELHGISKKKMYYHKQEFFAKEQFMELKKKEKNFNYKKDNGETDKADLVI